MFILEELHKRLEQERDRLAEEVFNRLLREDKMRFMVVLRDLGMNRLPRKMEIQKQVVRATRLDGDQFRLNLFDPVEADSLNSLEREVASFLDEQSKLYFWYPSRIPSKIGASRVKGVREVTCGSLLFPPMSGEQAQLRWWSDIGRIRNSS